MNITTPLQSTDTTVNQLDENIKVASEEILESVYNNCFGSVQSIAGPDNPEEFKKILFNIIKRNIEGNVNWKVR
jgi:hypothetical protein